MPSLVIAGGRRVTGSIRVHGAKNAILPILAACIMTKYPVVIYDCPKLYDVINMLEILKDLGCYVEWTGGRLVIDAKNANKCEMPESLSKELRSSIFLLGPIIARFKKAFVAYPGGCDIGMRPIDFHLRGLRELKVEISEQHGQIICNGESMRPGEIHLDYPSVGATENVMMAAVLIPGETVVYNAAREPEIVDLQDFINKMGGNIKGAGTSVVTINGVKELGAVEFRIMPDRIVAGTLMAAAAATAGELTLHNVRVPYLHSCISKLREAGCAFNIGDNDVLTIRGPARPKELVMLETLPYPGFPTDMQAQMVALCAIANGTSVVVENVFENRFKHVPELVKMGAKINTKDRMAVIRGVAALQGAKVTAMDLRGGAALVLAGLCANGETTVHDVQHIDRGYECIEGMFNAVGADIKRVGE